MIRRDLFTTQSILWEAVNLSATAFGIEQMFDDPEILNKEAEFESSRTWMLWKYDQMKVIQGVLDKNTPAIDECFSFLGTPRKLDAFEDSDEIGLALKDVKSLSKLNAFTPRIQKKIINLPREPWIVLILHDVIEAIGHELQGLNCHNGQPHNWNSVQLQRSIKLKLSAAKPYPSQVIDPEDKADFITKLNYIQSHYRTDLTSVRDYIRDNHPLLTLVRKAWVWQTN